MSLLRADELYGFHVELDEYSSKRQLFVLFVGTYAMYRT